MEYKQQLFPVLHKVIEDYVDVDLIELAHDLYNIMPINHTILTVNVDKYLEMFIKTFNNDLPDYISGDITKEDFIEGLVSDIFYKLVYLADTQQETIDEIYEKAAPIVNKYLEVHPINV